MAVSFDASHSYDPDGEIVSYLWDFGDGTTKQGWNEMVASHRYSKSGLYTVSLTVKDDKGAEATKTTTIKVMTEQEKGACYVSDIEMSIRKHWLFWVSAKAVVTIVDDQGNPLAGARIKGYWQGAVRPLGAIAITNPQGKATFISSPQWALGKKLTFTFIVDKVFKQGWTYESASNIETEDSVSYP